MKTIVQLYPNSNVFGIEHSDEHVRWVVVNERQLKIFNDVSWLVCSLITNLNEDDCEYNIADGNESAAFLMLNEMLSELILTDLNKE
jgi:hypothetical protein